MPTLVDRAKMSTPTVGTGTLTLGSALPGFQTFDAAGVITGQSVRYALEDGVNWELGLGQYTSPNQLTRAPSESSNGGSAIILSGTAVVYVTISARDLGLFAPLNANVIMITAGLVYSCTGSEQYVIVKKTLISSMSINLPAIPTGGQLLHIKDGNGTASLFPITLASSSTAPIDGARTMIMDQPYQSVTLLYTEDDWNIV